jgi:hypothetical protein
LALPRPRHNIVERRAAARRKTTEIADQWAQALLRARLAAAAPPMSVMTSHRFTWSG